MIGGRKFSQRKDIKLIDGFPGGMFPQVCSVCVLTVHSKKIKKATLGHETSAMKSKLRETARFCINNALYHHHQGLQMAGAEAKRCRLIKGIKKRKLITEVVP